jgi:hypothetical protein
VGYPASVPALLSLLLLALSLHAQDVRKVWKTYPVYHPEKAPPDYIEWLRTQQPEQITQPDGETLFHAPIVIGSLAARPPSDPPFLHDKAWFDRVNPPLNREGAITGFVYVLRTKGKVEIGTYSCATCHTHVMPNGAVITGGPGNFPVDAALAEDLLASIPNAPFREANKDFLRRLFLFSGDFGLANVAKTLEGRPPGIMTPQLSNPSHPVKIPGIIGAPGRRYLDHTGRFENNGPADFARYIVEKQKVYSPADRASDEQIQILAAYITNLKSPPSPYKSDKFTRQGEKVFQREGCPACHSAETKLIPATVVKTDPGLTTETKRGTGNYRVPPLQGLWYRGLLGHNGAGTSLEDWFSPVRLQYLKGHEYGFQLNGADRAALIAYLRTL